MTLKYYLSFLFVIAHIAVFSQNNETIFSIDGKVISTDEFLRVYNKNLEIIVDDDQKEIKNYLDLYVNYKLKVKQAIDLGYDTLTSYKKELLTYKKQLMEPYLKDDAFISKLVKEAYDRSLLEINASHILVKFPPMAGDTMKAFNKINEARTKLKKGGDFLSVAKKYSDDGSAQTNGGKLGYFSVFDMVYPFEREAYNVEVGEISRVFKTRFGYHIVKVNAIRAARGEVEAAHIMIQGDSITSKEKMDQIYQDLMNGVESFERMAEKHSEDKNTAKKGGYLGRFGSGKMVIEFEEVSFALEDKGAISKPFKTQFGWHIIKLIKKYPIESFEDQEKELTSKVRRGDRASIVSNSIVPRIRDNYTLNVNDTALQVFNTPNWKTANLDSELLTIKEVSVSQNELKAYLNDRDFTEGLFKKFKDFQILEYYKAHLEETNKEFAGTYLEYKEGLLLFELLQKRIWNKSKDSVGIENYFNNHKMVYNGKLEENRGKVSNDYQGYLEKLWIEELHETYKVVINEPVLTKLIEAHK